MIEATGRDTVLSVTIGGVTVPGVSSARVSYGPTLPEGGGSPVSEARVVCAAAPEGVDFGAEMVVQMGVSGSGNETQDRLRCIWRDSDRRYFGQSITLIGRGPLWVASNYENWEQGATWAEQGLGLDDLGASEDALIVKAALTRAGLGSFISPTLVGGVPRWVGTGRTMGVDNPEAFIWRAGFADVTSMNDYQGPGQTALAYAQAIDAISAVWDEVTSVVGFFLTFDGPNGMIWRVDFPGVGALTADATFTEGVDIADVGFSRGTSGIRNAVLVNGYDAGDGAGAVQHLLVQSSPYAVGQQTATFSSPLIEQATFADVVTIGYGMSCEEVAHALAFYTNRRQGGIRLTTPRDDIVIPGQTHEIIAPTRLSIASENHLVARVECERTNRGGFRQTITYA